MSRPKGLDPRQVVSIRLSGAEAKLIEKAAARAKMHPGVYIRTAALAGVKRDARTAARLKRAKEPRPPVVDPRQQTMLADPAPAEIVSGLIAIPEDAPKKRKKRKAKK